MDIVILFVVFAIIGLAIFGGLLKYKHRLIWNELFDLRNRLQKLKRENIEMRKNIALSSIEQFRLMPKMPSQHGEELVLWEYFDRKTDGFFVEIGAYDGVTFSNTYFFETIGWDGILVEPNPSQFKACAENRPYSKVVNAAILSSKDAGTTILSICEGAGGVDTLSYTVCEPQHLKRIEKSKARIYEIEIPVSTMDYLLQGVEQAIDFVSIDVEGAEIEVLKGFDIQLYSPKVLVIEDNSQGLDNRVKEFLEKCYYIEKLRLGGNVFYTKTSDSRVLSC